MVWLDQLRSDLRQEFGSRPKVMVLATSSLTGEPSARCMICREIDDEGGLWFTTDLRSEKMNDITRRSLAECVAWLAASRKQYRLRGQLLVHTDPAVHQRLWTQLSPATRATFLGGPPGSAVGQVTPTHATDLPSTPPANFGVIRLAADRVELLDLNTDPHTRTRWETVSGWKRSAVNP